MATTSTLFNRIANAAAEAKAATLRQQMKFAEARNGTPMGAGASVLTDAAKSDLNGDDERFCAKPDPKY